MADVLPKNRATGPLAKSPKPLETQDTGKLSNKGDGSLTNVKLSAKLRSPTAAPSPQSIESPTQNGNGAEGRRPPEAAMDPLSQQILQRTNTAPTIPKLRIQTTDSISVQSPTQPNDGHADTKYTGDAARELGTAHKADKKKGVSFLSRFIGGNKRKGALGATGDDVSEAGDARPEGMDAQLFSHTVDNFGFSPRHAQPPAYIKVRSKFKKDKEFDRVFLAQELRTGATKKSSPAAGGPPAPQSGAAALHNPIWAIEFSKDGKYMAAGGQDKIVRVWAVISSPEERRAHEQHESDPTSTEGGSTHLSAPVFQQKTFREYHGHTATILDLSFSKNNFLLSSGMDKTVRLWHVSRSENLCTFKHSDFVPSIQFHPKDDRFFLAGSLDNKLRLWSIPDKSVAYWTQLSEMITAVTFTPDGKTCAAGTVGGLCVFFETEGLKWQSQLHVKSTRGQNAKGSKITGIQSVESKTGEVKLLVTSNDSRIRIYNLKDKSLEMKIRGHENNCSQIRASFASDTGHIICGSEDRKAYIWSTTSPEVYQNNQSPVEIFEAHNTIATCAIMAPLKTRQLLSASEDPVYDLCNPPPVTLLSREESSVNGSRAPTEAGSVQPTPLEATFKRVAESPAYIARSAHHDGNIIITSDYTGALKVFRQDCAYLKRMRDDGWDSSSIFSKRTSKLGRPSSILSRGTGRSRRDSTSTQPPHDRIMSWRQDISHGGFDSPNSTLSRKGHGRSTSPRKSRAPLSVNSSRAPNSPSLAPTSATDASHPAQKAASDVFVSIEHTPADSTTQSRPSTPRSNSNTRFSQTPSFDPLEPLDPKAAATDTNPLSVYNGQSWAFWNISGHKNKTEQRNALAPPEDDPKRPDLRGRTSTVSKLSSEMSDASREDDDDEHYMCKKCGAKEFKVRVRGLGGHEERYFVCGKCGAEVE